MSKVFLAYKREDAARAGAVREQLEALGVPLFIDQKLQSGENYLAVINGELSTAVAVLVLWTEAAVRMPASSQTNFVQSEAQKGYARGILVAATFEKIALDHLPVPFNVFQTADLSDWIETGKSADHRGWQMVLEALAKKLGRPGLPDLALVLANGSDDAKRKFIRDFPADPFSPQFVAKFEAFERKAFDERLATARKRMQQRAKDTEKRLKDCRDEFEAQIAELRAGHDFMPPDPVTALDDNVAKLTDQIEIYERALDEARAQLDQAQGSAAQANAEIAALKSEIEALTRRAATPDKQNAAVEQLTADLAERDSKIVNYRETIDSQISRIAQLTDEVADRRRDLETKDGRVQDLEASVTALKQYRERERGRLIAWSGAAALLAAGFVGSIFAFGAVTRSVPAAAGGSSQTAAAQGATQSAATPAALVSQCDALAAFQYDPDRPPSSGWVDSYKNMFADALPVCQSAQQAPSSDPVVQRRMLLEMGRSFQATGSMRDAVNAWNQAGKFGSGQAFHELANYSMQAGDLKNAWTLFKQSADLGNPMSLNTVAVSQLFPDWYFNITTLNRQSGLQYLQQALKADFPRSYYVAGVAYWDSDNAAAVKYLTISYCSKHDGDADTFFFKKRQQHLVCQ